MQVKVFQFDKNGKVSFTQAELEKLLNEVYNGGYWDGKRSNNYWTWTSPYYTYTTTTGNEWYGNTATVKGSNISPNITWTTSANSTDKGFTLQMETSDSVQDTASHIN